MSNSELCKIDFIEHTKYALDFVTVMFTTGVILDSLYEYCIRNCALVLQ